MTHVQRWGLPGATRQTSKPLHLRTLSGNLILAWFISSLVWHPWGGNETQVPTTRWGHWFLARTSSLLACASRLVFDGEMLETCMIRSLSELLNQRIKIISHYLLWRMCKNAQLFTTSSAPDIQLGSAVPVVSGYGFV